MALMDQIVLKGICLKRAGKTILDSIDLRISAGEKVAVFGPTFSGKTCLLLVAAGMLKATRGQASIAGRLPAKVNSVRSEVGVGTVESATSLYEKLTVYENAKFWARSRGIWSGKEAILDAISIWDLTASKDILAEDISALDRALLSCAIAFMGNPSVVMLDEPTSRLTENESRKIWPMIEKAGEGKTLLFTTIREREAVAHADRTVRIEEGRLAGGGHHE